MPPGRLHVFTAVLLEARAIRRATADLPLAPRVEPIGIGADLLPEDCPDPNARFVIAGLGGGLNPSLAVGDVVVDDPGEVLPRSVALRRGRITTSQQMISTPQQKASLFAATGAAAVDMEQRIVFERARAWGVPCIGVRAISDAAADTLDPLVLTLIDRRGMVRPVALTQALIRRPALVPYLRRLGRSSNFAATQLGVAIREIAVAVASA